MTRLAGVVLAAGLAGACGGNASSPLAPTAVTPRGATLRGTLEGSAASSSAQLSSQAAAGVRVSVTGTSLATVTNSQGQFLLAGVPSGRVELRFEAPGLDARLEIAGLLDGQELEITVSLSGGQAVLVSGSGPSGSPSASPAPTPDDDDDEHGEEIEYEGPISALGASSLTVGSRTATVTSATKIKRDDQTLPFSALTVGMQVEVKAERQPDGSLVARKIKVEDEDHDEDDDEHGAEVEFKGSIQTIGGSTWTVAGRTVITDANTRYRDRDGHAVGPDYFHVGDRVEVEGRAQGSAVLAEKIKCDDD